VRSIGMLTGDTFHSLRCDCGEQLDYALDQIAKEKCGVLLYIRRRARYRLLNKLKAYELQERGYDTVEANLELGFGADEREWGIATRSWSISGSRLSACSPQPAQAEHRRLRLTIVEQVPIRHSAQRQKRRYLATKRISSDIVCTIKVNTSIRSWRLKSERSGTDDTRPGQPPFDHDQNPWPGQPGYEALSPPVYPESEVPQEPTPQLTKPFYAAVETERRARVHGEHAEGELIIPSGYRTIEGLRPAAAARWRSRSALQREITSACWRAL